MELRNKYTKITINMEFTEDGISEWYKKIENLNLFERHHVLSPGDLKGMKVFEVLVQMGTSR